MILFEINILISTNANRTTKYKRRRGSLCGVRLPLPSDYESTETKLFRAGLKHYRGQEERLIKNTRRSPNHDYHDLIDYERVEKQ